MRMGGKKGKDIATKMILGDLLEEDDTRESPLPKENPPKDFPTLKKSPLSPKAERERDKDNATKISANDKTFQLNESQIVGQAKSLGKNGQDSASHSQSSTFVLPERAKEKVPPVATSVSAVDNVRQSVGKFATGRPSSAFNPAVASLAQSENLRVAQQRILDLEQEVEKMREENAKLVTAGEMIRKRADELLTKSESMEAKYQLDVSSLADEKELLQASLSVRDQEIGQLKAQIEEMDTRLNSTMQKVRMRERELENRLELVKMESSALVHNKDEFILELKRQIDQLTMELDNYRNKGQELNRQLSQKQEMLKRTVKALRIALTMLEGADDNPLKKVK